LFVFDILNDISPLWVCPSIAIENIST